MFVRYIQKEGK